MFSKKPTSEPPNKTEAKSPKRPAFHLSDSSANRLIMGLALLAVGGSLFVGWQNLQVSPSASDSLPSLPSVATAVYSVPVLKLNTTHQRQGAVIQVNPSNIGRDNPFTKP